jgi:FkbM family methyltransferase
MLIHLESLIKKYGIIFKGILHVGAHECEELNDYEKYISRDKILWIDALEDKVILCKERYPNILIEEAVISDKEEIVTFHRSNNGQSSSILEFGLHKVFHPQVWYVDSFQKKTTLLNTILDKYQSIPFNFVNLDIQGVELKALKSMELYLSKIEYIYTEVNSDYVYEGCSLIGEIDEYLGKFGFIRTETSWCCDYRWGDAFYVNLSILQSIQ